MAKFAEGSRRKIERAEKHIDSIDLLRFKVSGRQHYTLSVEQDANRINWLSLDFDATALPAPEASLVIGDALHNLRSALDILWHEIILACRGQASKYSRFIVMDTADELRSKLNSALKDQRINQTVVDFMMDTIKPYKVGNYALWALDDLNIIDKHKLIIPVLKWVWITGVRFQDGEGNILDAPILIADKPWRERLPMEFYRKNLTIKDKGHSSPNIFFDLGFPFQGEPVIPVLRRISEAVTSTVSKFEALLGMG